MRKNSVCNLTQKGHCKIFKKCKDKNVKKRENPFSQDEKSFHFTYLKFRLNYIDVFSIKNVKMRKFLEKHKKLQIYVKKCEIPCPESRDMV